MTNVLNSEFNAYVRFIATDLSGGRLITRPSTISVNLDGLSDDKAQLASAKMALAQWSQVTGLTFVNASASQARIVFTNDSASGAYTAWTGSHSVIDVSKNWLSNWAPSARWGVGSYGFYTFMHELGHALGLAHGGEYNGSAVYEKDHMFNIDTWQYSMMSYFDQTKYAPNHASYIFPGGPLLADIEAVKLIYGNLPANVGNTVYGAGSTVMNGVTDFGKYAKSAFAIHDTGGYDTINLSNARAASMLDLRPGHFSDVNGYVGNVGIAADTIIERAIGSAYGDQIIGNDAGNVLVGLGGNDVIDGGAGNDVINGGEGNDRLTGGAGKDVFVFEGKINAGSNVDVITDFNPVDDVIYLENAVFKSLRKVGELAASAFTSNEEGRALDASDRVIYDSHTGNLYYDADGTGGQSAVLFAKLTAGLALTNHDFIIT